MNYIFGGELADRGLLTDSDVLATLTVAMPIHTPSVLDTIHCPSLENKNKDDNGSANLVGAAFS